MPDSYYFTECVNVRINATNIESVKNYRPDLLFINAHGNINHKDSKHHVWFEDEYSMPTKELLFYVNEDKENTVIINSCHSATQAESFFELINPNSTVITNSKENPKPSLHNNLKFPKFIESFYTNNQDTSLAFLDNIEYFAGAGVQYLTSNQTFNINPDNSTLQSEEEAHSSLLRSYHNFIDFTNISQYQRAFSPEEIYRYATEYSLSYLNLKSRNATQTKFEDTKGSNKKEILTAQYNEYLRYNFLLEQHLRDLIYDIQLDSNNQKLTDEACTNSKDWLLTAVRYGAKEVVTFLLEKCHLNPNYFLNTSNIMEVMTPLLSAITHNQTEIVKILLPYTDMHNIPFNPITLSAIKRNVDIVKTLIEEYKMDPNIKFRNPEYYLSGQNYLMRFMGNDDKELTEYLSRVTNLELTDDHGYTAMHHAVKDNDVDAIMILSKYPKLLEREIIVNLTNQLKSHLIKAYNLMLSPLPSMLIYNYTNIIIDNEDPEDVEEYVIENTPQTPLQLATLHHPNITVVETLLKVGANPYVKNSLGLSAIDNAAKFCNQEILKIFVDNCLQEQSEANLDCQEILCEYPAFATIMGNCDTYDL